MSLKLPYMVWNTVYSYFIEKVYRYKYLRNTQTQRNIYLRCEKSMWSHGEAQGGHFQRPKYGSLHDKGLNKYLLY